MNLQNGWWFNDDVQNRPYVISYSKETSPRTYLVSNPPWYTWQSGYLWDSDGMSILFVNTTDQDLKLSSIGIKTVSCNSGGQPFVAYSKQWGYYYVGLHANGAAAVFSSYYRVCNNLKNVDFAGISVGDGQAVVDILNRSSNVWEQSNSFSHDIARVTSTNMDTAGSISGKQTATFGEKSGYPDNAQFKQRTYTFTECPIIEANGGICTLHIDVKVSWSNPSTSYPNVPFVRVLLDPNEMEIIFNEERGPYIWRMTNGKWVLKRPLQVYTGSAWSDIENQGGDNN